MIQDPDKDLLKTFQGRKIDESVHVARWGTNFNSNQDSIKNQFMKYADSSSSNVKNISQNIRQSRQQSNNINTQVSQVHEINTGFKKLKTDQIQILKELKQQYEVLRNLKLQQKQAKPVSKVSESSSRDDRSQIVSASSKKSKKQKIGAGRQNQILALEKKQLQIVINNSMKKIEELLHNQMQYKKQIHDLKMQVSGRNNTDMQFENMMKTMKKSQINSHQAIQSLKRQNQKLRFTIKQSSDKIGHLQGELIVKDQQIRRAFQEKRRTEDLIRIQKDRFFNIDIDYKKIKMEYEILQKDKNSEITRLVRQLEFKEGNTVKQLQNVNKRLEEEINIKDHRYQILLHQLQEMKKMHQNQNILDKSHVQEVLNKFKQQNNSSIFNENMNQVLEKLHQMDGDQNEYLKNEIQRLSIELDEIRNNNRQSQNLMFNERAEQFQRTLNYERSQKQNLYAELKRIKRDYQELQRKYNQYQRDLEQYQSNERKLREEIRTLRTGKLSNTIQVTQQKSSSIANLDIEIIQREILQLKNKNKASIDKLEEEIRLWKRKADQNQFAADKALKEGQFKLTLLQNDHNGQMARIRQDLERSKKFQIQLRDQFEKYKVMTEQKILIRQQQLQKLRQTLRNREDDTKCASNNLKAEYQNSLKVERERYKMELEQALTMIQTLTKSNQKYLQESSKFVHYENEINCMRQAMRRTKKLNDGVDHLWHIKQTQYQNVNQVLRRIIH